MTAEWLIAAAAIAQVAVVLAAALLAWFQVNEARALRRAQARPYVVIDFEIEGGIFIFLRITNHGSSIARNVRFAFDKPLESTLDKQPPRVAEVGMLSRGIPSLAPGKSIATLFDSFPPRLKSGLPDSYDATITYEGVLRGERYTETTILDLGVYRNVTQMNRRDIHDIHKQIEVIAKELKKWTSPLGGGLLTRSMKEVRQMMDERRTQREERRRERGQQ